MRALKTWGTVSSRLVEKARTPDPGKALDGSSCQDDRQDLLTQCAIRELLDPTRKAEGLGKTYVAGCHDDGRQHSQRQLGI